MHQEPVAPKCDKHVTVVRIRPLVPILDLSERRPRPFGIWADAPDTQLGLAVELERRKSGRLGDDDE